MDSSTNQNEDVEVLEKNNQDSDTQKEDDTKEDSSKVETENETAQKTDSDDAEIINLDDLEDVNEISEKNEKTEKPEEPEVAAKESNVKSPPTRENSPPQHMDVTVDENVAEDKNIAEDKIVAESKNVAETLKEDEMKTRENESEMELQEEEDEEIEEEDKTKKPTSPSDKKDTSLVDNQVQCVNLHCQSGYDLAEAPVFVLTHFGVVHRKNVLQKVCRACFDIVLAHQEKMCDMLLNKVPLMTIDFPSQKDDVVVMDSVEEIYEEEVLPKSVISMVEEQLVDLMKSALDKYDIDFQIEKNQEILNKKFDDLADCNKKINDELHFLENQLRGTRDLIYKDFNPRLKSLPPLNITEYPEPPKPPLRARAVATKKSASRPFQNLPLLAPKPVPITPNTESHDIVAVKEVEVPQVKLPPIGNLIHPTLYVGCPVYVMKVSFYGVWVKAKVMDIVSKTPEAAHSYRVRFDSPSHGGYKVVTGKQLAYSKASSVRYPVGTRVIALFHNTDYPGKNAYYAGVVAEPPKILNIFRYLVFFDDGYAQYVPHEKILLVCESSRFVHEDIHPDSRDFIKSYLDQYPERPMVKLQKGQVLKTEWNGKWWNARVMAIDGSLAKMHFDADNRTEWIYRGSTRLGPLYSELIAAAARKEQGALSRHRSLGIASLKKRNMPYVEYSVDQDDAKTSQTTTVSKNVAKKSTASRSISQDSSEKNLGPPKPNEKMEHTTKGYIRPINLNGRLESKPFAPHQCGPSCISWTNYSPTDCKGTNPLAIPFFYGFQRQIVRVKGKKVISYRGPCGRRLRNIIEMHRYLRITKSSMGLDLFDFDHWVQVLEEFHLDSDMYCTHIKDISYGHENVPVSCVNEINHSWPAFMNYSTSRIPQEGVNICLDEEFLVCCDCVDDCQDKEKCECWQLTIEGTKLGPGGEADSSVGYQFKRLPEPVPTGIYECNQRCKCASTCLNRVAQHPLQLNLQVFRTLRKGWGLRTLNDIPKGGFICIYAGRLHTEQSANDDGRMYGDEYLAELDYIEVVERIKEGYESDVIEPDDGKNVEDDDPEEEYEMDESGEQDDLDEGQMNGDDIDYVPQGLTKLPKSENVVNTRGRNKKLNSEEKSESEGEKEKEEPPPIVTENCNPDDDDGEIKKQPSKFTAAVPVEEEKPSKHKSVREMFGDGADDCYIMDAKSSGNIGRYLNHSCQPNVFVQNVFVDTHDVRFPWVSFFALSYIKAGTELTWDYNYDVGSVPGKVLYCYCNSAECRGRLL